MSQNFNRIQNSIINIHNCHRERIPTPDSSRSTVSEPKIKRRKKLTYLVGQGSKEWEHSCPLVIKDVDVTKVLKRFRDQNVKSADDGHLLGDVRVLSLSHVFPLADYADDKCVLNYLKDDEKEALKQCRSSLFDQKMNEVSDEAVLFCHKASKSKESVLQPKNNYDEVIADICRQMIKGRAAFINLHLMEFVNKILIDNESKTTSHVMMDCPCIEGKKPDFALSTKTRKQDVFLFFVEVKRDKADSKYQTESDFVKLMKQMQYSIDQQLRMGVETSKLFGLLCEGSSCEFYSMKLAVKGVYLSFLTRQFRLVETKADLVYVPAIVETLGYVRNELEQLKVSIDKANKRDKRRQKKLIKVFFQTVFK